MRAFVLSVVVSLAGCAAEIDKLSCGEGTMEQAGECVPAVVADADADADTDADTDADADADVDVEDTGDGPVDADGGPVDTGSLAEDGDGDGFTAADGDCNDEDPSINPDAFETCDELDNDCDGEVDEDAIDSVIGLMDADGDGYGDDRFPMIACTLGAGFVDVGGDCDDTSATTHPGAAERCDEIDNDCDREVDEDVMRTWYADVDGDGYGDADAAIASCDPGPGFAATDTDCDDTNPAMHPGAVEVCDGEDNNCNGSADDGAIDATPWYADGDGDGYGDGASTIACEAVPGYVSEDGDCNDEDPSINPGAAEVCDDLDTDEDCSGLADDDDGGVVGSGMSIWYADADGDGYGSMTMGFARCDGMEGYVASATDCDDADPSINPMATESCNGRDDDCDGTTDEADASDAATWYADDDGDGYGDADSTTEACTAGPGFVADSSDCDDDNPSVSPAALERCNELDDDCDGFTDETDAIDAITWYVDFDGDGFGRSDETLVGCSAPAYFADAAGDCDDDDELVYPGADEWCNDADDDCDGEVDEAGAVDGETWYADADGDGYGSPYVTADSCAELSGYVDNDGDCDDTDDTTYPGAPEGCDGGDKDCDGVAGEGLEITVEGAVDDIMVCTSCAEGDFYCQAQQVCDEVTGETCVWQDYDCAYGNRGSWYPPSHGGSSNFNFAYDYDFSGGDYGNICDCIGVSSSYGIGTDYRHCGTGHWIRR